MCDQKVSLSRCEKALPSTIAPVFYGQVQWPPKNGTRVFVVQKVEKHISHQLSRRMAGWKAWTREKWQREGRAMVEYGKCGKYGKSTTGNKRGKIAQSVQRLRFYSTAMNGFRPCL